MDGVPCQFLSLVSKALTNITILFHLLAPEPAQQPHQCRCTTRCGTESPTAVTPQAQHRHICSGDEVVNMLCIALHRMRYDLTSCMHVCSPARMRHIQHSDQAHAQVSVHACHALSVTTTNAPHTNRHPAEWADAQGACAHLTHTFLLHMRALQPNCVRQSYNIMQNQQLRSSRYCNL
jgi:hypothetical protein